MLTNVIFFSQIVKLNIFVKKKNQLAMSLINYD